MTAPFARGLLGWKRSSKDKLNWPLVPNAEPLPSRLASIARGTGEVDAVYQVAFDALPAFPHHGIARADNTMPSS